MKYRSSCDSCQDSKVKCSRVKPSCQRCTRKGLKCIYSPLRTIGRPKNRPLSNGARDDAATCKAGMHPGEQRYRPPIVATVELSNGIDDALEKTLPSLSALSSQTRFSEYLSDTIEHVLSYEPVTGPSTEGHSSPGRSGTIGVCDILPGNTPNSMLVLSGEEDIHPAPYRTDDWLGSCHQHQDFPTIGPSENTYTERLDNYPRTFSNATAEIGPNHQYRRDDAKSSEAFSRNQLTMSSNMVDPNTDCYIMLLNHLTHIETALATKPPMHPPPIDFTLRAESDLQDLKKRIFTCQSHNTMDITEAGTRESLPCLSSSRPVLLVICLLADRVVYLFEELFRRVNLLAQNFDEPPQVALCASTRRMTRTMRSMLDYSSTCPFPEANRPLHIGSFAVSDEVKTRALRRILRGRIRGLLATLGDMKREIEARQNDQQRSNAQGKLLDLGGSKAAASEALGKTVGELYLRVESLLGRLDLTGQ